MSAESDESYTDLYVTFENGPTLAETTDLTVMEINLSESLLTPGLQTSVRFHSALTGASEEGIKNLDNFKYAQMNIAAEKLSLATFGYRTALDISQPVYRLDRRKLYNNNVEEFYLNACDPTLLSDAERLISKSWKCESPSDIVKYALLSCAGARNVDIEPSGPRRDYMAENIHPFQVVAQQTNYALFGGNDPSFLHYMTYQNNGTHHFRSLATLTAQKPIIHYVYSEAGGAANALANPRNVITYSFPCDFDVLSDILNGMGVAPGSLLSSVVLINPLFKSFSMIGGEQYGCGIGEGVLNYAISNQNSAQQQDSCPDYAKVYLLKRQARMGLLERHRIALRLTVPFNPELNVGKMIRFSTYNKDTNPPVENYGSGRYLILHMTHNIKYGGYATTTMDCVSETVGYGIV